MEMPKPSEAHRKLETMVGSWSGEERMSPSPWDPKGGTAVGRVNNRRALDGFIVVQEYEQERNGAVTFRGHGVFSWDTGRSSYVLHWFDSMGMPPNEFVGNFEGNSLVLTSKGSHGQTRTVWEFPGGNASRFRMEFSPDGGQWSTLMEGQYTRQN